MVSRGVENLKKLYKGIAEVFSIKAFKVIVELVVPDPDDHGAGQAQPNMGGADVLVSNYSLEALSDQPEASPKHGSVKVKLHERLEREFHSYSWKIPVALACILLGIMIGLQYRTQASNIPVQADDRRKMLELVRTLEAERNKLSSELTEVRGRIADIEDEYVAGTRLHAKRNLAPLATNLCRPFLLRK